MRLYQFYTAATANLGIQMLTRGHITCVLWSLVAPNPAGGSGVVAELSFQGTSQVTTNNPVGIISIANLQVQQSTAAGLLQSSQNFFHGGIWCPVNVGDIIYLNATITAAGSVRALLHVQEGGK